MKVIRYFIGQPWIAIGIVSTLSFTRPMTWPYPVRVIYSLIVFAAIIRFIVYLIGDDIKRMRQPRNTGR